MSGKKGKVVNGKTIYYYLKTGSAWPRTSPLTSKIYIGDKLAEKLKNKELDGILAHEEYHALTFKSIKLRITIFFLYIVLIMSIFIGILSACLSIVLKSYAILYTPILFLVIFFTGTSLYLYLIKDNERAADMYAYSQVGISTLLASLNKLEKLKKSGIAKPPILNLLYEFTHQKFEERIGFIKTLESRKK